MTTDRTHVAVAAAARRSWEAHQDVVPPPLAAMNIPHSECRDNVFEKSSIEMAFAWVYRRRLSFPSTEAGNFFKLNSTDSST